MNTITGRWLSSLALLSLMPIGAAWGGKPPSPTADPCVSPSVVTEATFPSFYFHQIVPTGAGTYASSTFLADASGKCTRLVGGWAGDRHKSFRYNNATNVALFIAVDVSPGEAVVATTTSVSFGVDGPAVSTLDEQRTILRAHDLTTPADLAAAGWVPSTSIVSPWISPDGTQLLFKSGFANSPVEPSQSFGAFWVCDVTYDSQSTINPIDPMSCHNVHRTPPNTDCCEVGYWGARPGTIYITQPATRDPQQYSLYRLTLQPPPAPALTEEIFSNGDIFNSIRVTAVPAGPDVPSGELVALHGGGNILSMKCSQVYVIDAYDCADLSCRIVTQQGMRSVTWLPDGRLAGRKQTIPDRKQRCTMDKGHVWYPAIGPSGLPGTSLINPAEMPYVLCATCIEGDGGGW
jgi:hypothetical protein